MHCANNCFFLLLGIMAFLWFVNFCYMAAGWSRAKDANPDLVKGSAEGAISFAFFSICIFVSISHCT